MDDPTNADGNPRPTAAVSPATTVQTEPNVPESVGTATVTNPQTVEIDPAVIQAATAAVISQLKPVAEAAAAQTARGILDDFKKTQLGQRVVGFFDSAVGKSFQTLLWTAGAYALTVIGAWLANIHLDARLVSLGIPGLLNWVFYTCKVLVDSKVPNLPSSSVK